MTDPDFERFWATEFQRLLEHTSIPGMGEASWDRRAAWLLWRALHPVPPINLEFVKDTTDASNIYRETSSASSVFD